MSQFKIGMLGAGQISYRHCDGINAHPNAEVVAVADPSEERAQALREKYQLARHYLTADELIADPDLDAISIAVPNVFHAEYAIAALKAGKHVMLDKPFTLSFEEAESVARTARETGKVMTVGMNMRFREESQLVKMEIERGLLGEIYHGKAYWFRRSGIPKFGTWFCRKDMAGGGVLLDVGVHLLDLCLYLMDNFEPEAVFGSTYSKFGPRGLGEGTWGMSTPGEHIFDVEDFATALIKLKDGASMTLDVSWAIHQADVNRHNVEVFGTEAGITAFDSRVSRFGKEKGEYEVTVPEKAPVPHAADNRFINWIDTILEKAAPVCTLDQALAVQKILDGIYESARTGREVRV